MRDKGKLLMFFLIGSEAFFFIALIIAYVYYRNITHATDTVTANLNVPRAAVLTCCLVLSSGSLMWSKKAFLKNKTTHFKLGMSITLILSTVFMGGQIIEYIELYKKQITLDKDIFGSSFFTLTGFHSLHVIIGIIAIGILFSFSFIKFKNLIKNAISAVEVYWHFVDVVWLFVFFFVYIKPLL
tara:strand:- start:1405 stop:1956 length:552 start_codon:yes stop_codon:yes gene_type:complete